MADQKKQLQAWSWNVSLPYKMPALQATLHILSNAWWSKIVFLLFSEESFDSYWEGEKDKKRRPNLFDDDDDSSFGWIDSKEVADLMKQSRRLASNDDDDDDEELGEAWGGVEYSLNSGMMSQKKWCNEYYNNWVWWTLTTFTALYNEINISIHIFHTLLYTFPLLLTKRFHVTIKVS